MVLVSVSVSESYQYVDGIMVLEDAEVYQPIKQVWVPTKLAIIVIRAVAVCCHLVLFLSFEYNKKRHNREYCDEVKSFVTKIINSFHLRCCIMITMIIVSIFQNQVISHTI